MGLVLRLLIATGFLAGALVGSFGGAHAQGISRSCVQIVNAQGQNNCVDYWAPKLLNALSTTVTTVKGSAGQLGSVYCFNPNASVAYIQIFDAATTGAVTLGTTTPKLSFGITPTAGMVPLPLSVMAAGFLNGIQVAATTTATGNTAPGTAMDCNALFN